MKRILILLSLSIALLFAGNIFADDVSRPDTARAAASQQNERLRSMLRYSRALMRQNDFEGASALLEILYEEKPGNSVLIHLLKQCYDKLQLHAKAEELMRRQIESDPNKLSNYLGYAESLARQGKMDRAAEVYDSATGIFESSSDVRYQAVLQSMISSGLEQNALDLIEKLRLESNDSTFYALQRGMILEKKKKYGQAALEFYKLLGDTLGVGQSAERRISELLDFGESSPEVEKTLLEKPDLFATAAAMRILATHYLKTGQYEKAFDFTITRDSIDGYNGQTLIVYMRDCNERKLFDQAVSMGDYLLERYRNVPQITQAYFFQSEALSYLGRHDDAIAVLEAAAEVMVRNRDRADAVYRIGRIYLDGLHDNQRALDYFDSVATLGPTGLVALNTKQAIPYCYLRMGRLEQARQRFKGLLNRRVGPEMQEEADYQLAAILFYENRVDSSRKAFSKLIVDYPRGYYVNDALEMMMTIDGAVDQSELLKKYAAALLFKERRLTDSTVSLLKQVAEVDGAPLAATALWKLVRISMNQADTTGALEYVGQMVERFADTYFLPYGLKIKADVYLLDADKVDEARQIYRDLLEKYPDYPFAAEVREKMRRLEPDAGSA